MKYALINENRGRQTVSLVAQVLAVTVGGFYAWPRRGQSQRARDDEVPSEKIMVFCCGGRCTCEQPRIRRDLRAAGHNIGRKCVARLVRSASVRGRTKRKFKTTTSSRHSRPKAEDFAEQSFDVAPPNTLWAGDITCLQLRAGFTSPSHSTFLKVAAQQQPVSATLTHHSDQRASPAGTVSPKAGSRYAGRAFQAKLDASSIQQSASGGAVTTTPSSSCSSRL